MFDVDTNPRVDIQIHSIPKTLVYDKGKMKIDQYDRLNI